LGLKEVYWGKICVGGLAAAGDGSKIGAFAPPAAVFNTQLFKTICRLFTLTVNPGARWKNAE